MPPAAQPRYTLLIPTYNRPHYVRSLLGYLGARQFKYPVRILDSSAPHVVSENRDLINRAGLDASHHVYDSSIHVSDKFARGLQTVETKYVSFCADDDILLVRELDPLLDFLDASSSYVAAHGYYFNFRPGSDFTIMDTTYSGPSISADDGLKRVVQQMHDYQAVSYAIYRTDVLQSVFSQLLRVRSLWAQELLASSLTLVAGAVYRTQQFYMGRNTNPSIATDGWSPHHFFATNPEELFMEYAAYRNVVLEQLAADKHCSSTYEPSQLRRAFDVVHLKYLGTMLSPAVLDHIIVESLHPGRQPQDIIAGIWSRFVSPAGDDKRGRQSVLVSVARGLLQPRATIDRVRRVIALRSALKQQNRLKVSIGSRFDNIKIDTATRGGNARRYVITSAFVGQELDDQQRTTARHIADIVDHLNDYV